MAYIVYENGMSVARWVLSVCLAVIIPTIAWAENMSVGLGPTGHFFLIDGTPQLSPGFGGHVYFDYRWAPQISTQFGIDVTTEGGKGPQAGDNDILFFAIPTVDFKYYFVKSSGRIDPYALLGIGFFMTSEGSADNGTLAMGLGANAGVGVDLYFTPAVSANIGATFHSIGMIQSLSGANNGSGLFPVTASGSVAFHF
ncbi:MAG: hypothetical protein HY696_07625 [Deltaproteobacteria bacterium]|nr:hypothetical protein [Deltaproteobacteria bacterium]